MSKIHYPRWLARLIAALGGYFWLPCPRCGRMFGGQEYGRTITPDGAMTGWVNCWRHDR